MRWLAVTIVGAVVTLGIPAWAMDCSDIRPAAPQNTDTSGGGKLELSVDGFFKKLVNPHAEVQASYRKVATDVLPQFPNADQVYMWQRVLFMECQTMKDDPAMTTDQKLDRFEKLLAMRRQPPPPLVTPTINNSITNSGDNNSAIQGNGNSVTIGGGKP